MIRFKVAPAQAYSFVELSEPDLRMPAYSTLKKGMAISRFTRRVLSPEQGYPPEPREARLSRPGAGPRVPDLEVF